MIRYLTLFFFMLSVVALQAHTEPIIENLLIENEPLKTLPVSSFSNTTSSKETPDWLNQTDLHDFLNSPKKKELEDLLSNELNRLNIENPQVMKMDSIGDDVSDGSIGQPLAEELAAINQARALIAKIKQGGKYIPQLTGEDLVTLPRGIKTTIGNVTYTLGIGSMIIRPTHAEISVVLEIDVPGKDPLLFGAPNLKFTKKGGIVGNACLGLLSDVSVDIVKHKSVLKLRKAVVDGNGTCSTGTYVEIDCDGFKSLSVDAEVIFSRDWIKPVDPQSTDRVTGSFLTQVSSWEDILIAIDMDDFVINKLEDIEFRVDTVVLDLSDTKMYSGINFPPNYVHPLKDTRLWKGFYMQQFRVFLPKRLAGGTGKFIDGSGIIIDDSGFTGKVSAYPNLIQLGQANLNGWAFSVDTFRIDILQQQFQQVLVAGKINLPIFNKENEQTPGPSDCFSYGATITAGNIYSFRVSPDQNYEVSMWKAYAEIESNSTLDIVIANGEVLVDAYIHGAISVDGDFGDNLQVNIDDIPFDSMHIANHGDYFSPGVWDFPETISAQIGNFYLGIEELNIEKETDGGITTAGLDFKLHVELDGDLEIDAQGGLKVMAELDRSGANHKWKVRNFGLTSFYYDGSFPGVESLTAGFEIFSGHEQYGSGFRGAAEVVFDGLGGKVAALAQFGNKDTKKYFLVDAMLELGKSIPIGGMEIKGFGGGIYRHMKRETDADVALSQMEGGDITQLGAGLSGLIYHFDPGISLGVKASVILATVGGDGESFNANLTLGMSFGPNDTGGIGIKRLFFEGVGKFMDKVDRGVAPETGGNTTSGPSGFTSTIRAFALVDLNFTERLYTLNLSLYIGESESDFIYGRAWAAAEINMKTRKWWLHIGTPDNRNQATINVLNTLQFHLTAYFAIGNTNIPSVPDPYTGIPSIDAFLVDEFSGYNGRTGNLDNGAGLVFGAGFRFGTGERKKFLFFYGEFNGAIGFDLGLTRQDSECTNSTGFKGWYAVGQAYAGFDAELGATIKFMGLSKTLVIVEAMVAAGIRFEGPNPSWVKAAVKYKLNVLGFIKFDGKFKFEVGEHRSANLPADCAIEVPDPLGDVADVMLELSLSGGETENVYVGANLVLDMAIPNNTEFRINAENGDTYAFRVNVMQINLYDGEGEDLLMGVPDPNTGWDAENMQMTRGYINFWPANATITAEYIARVEEEIIVDGESRWVFARDDNGEFYEEIKTLTFTTGDLIDVIPPENIKASYPLPEQRNFFPDQYSAGYYLYLTSNQNYLFNEVPEGYEVKARFRNIAGDIVFDDVPHSLFVGGDNNEHLPENRPGSMVEISKVALETQTDYILELAWIFTGEGGQPSELYGEEHVLHRTNFHTSKYKKLGDKISTIYQTSMNYQDGGNTYSEEDIMISSQKTSELFDVYDLNGVEGTAILPLVDIKIVKKDCDVDVWGNEDWYCNEAYYLDYTYLYLDDCAIPENLHAPVDAVRLIQEEGAVDQFDLHSSFPAKVYQHAALIYEYLEASGSCEGYEEIPPIPPSPGGGGEPLPPSELPTQVQILRTKLMTSGKMDERTAMYKKLLLEYTNIAHLTKSDPRDAAITLNAKFDKGGQINQNAQQYRSSYDAALAAGGSVTGFSYPIGTVETDGGTTNIAGGGNGIVIIDGWPVCAPQWVDEYCNYPILPANVYPSALFEVEVTYKLPWRPAVQTPSKGILKMVNN